MNPPGTPFKNPRDSAYLMQWGPNRFNRPRLPLAVKADEGDPLLLVDGTLREVVALRLGVERAEGLLVLGQVLPQHIPQGLGLLRAQKNRILVADGDLVGDVAGCQAEDQLEVPHADADLDAVSIGLAVVGGLDEVHLRLLRGWTHGFTRLLRPGHGCRGRAPGRRRRMDLPAFAGSHLPGGSFFHRGWRPDQSRLWHTGHKARALCPTPKTIPKLKTLSKMEAPSDENRQDFDSCSCVHRCFGDGSPAMPGRGTWQAPCLSARPEQPSRDARLLARPVRVEPIAGTLRHDPGTLRHDQGYWVLFDSLPGSGGQCFVGGGGCAGDEGYIFCMTAL